MNNFNIIKTAWKDWNEWKYVKELLYSTEKNLKFLGVQIVHMWRSRMDIPHYIDITAQLIQFYEKYLYLDNNYIEKSKCEEEIKHEGASIITRFVNGIIDANQKGPIANSVTYVANEIGLHRMFVDIRHESTHNLLPSWEIFSVAVPNALDWLYETYWVEQEKKLIVIDNVNESMKTKLGQFKYFIDNDKKQKNNNYNQILDGIFSNFCKDVKFDNFIDMLIIPFINYIDNNTIKKEKFDLFFKSLLNYFQKQFSFFYSEFLQELSNIYEIKSNEDNTNNLDNVTKLFLNECNISFPKSIITSSILSCIKSKHSSSQIILDYLISKYISDDYVIKHINDLKTLLKDQPIITDKITPLSEIEEKNIDQSFLSDINDYKQLIKQYPINTNKTNSIRILNEDEYNII